MRVSLGDRHGHTEAHREGDVKIEAEAAVMQLKPRDDLSQQKLEEARKDCLLHS